MREKFNRNEITGEAICNYCGKIIKWIDIINSNESEYTDRVKAEFYITIPHYDDTEKSNHIIAVGCKEIKREKLKEEFRIYGKLTVKCPHCNFKNLYENIIIEE
ncbi:hypothetical protein [Clostridium cadaveris]|uniref:hypothetical protein n=1 Tax=Clostridium cadaveris TaxID=1529 RepID=UPI003993755B